MFYYLLGIDSVLVLIAGYLLINFILTKPKKKLIKNNLNPIFLIDFFLNRR